MNNLKLKRVRRIPGRVSEVRRFSDTYELELAGKILLIRESFIRDRHLFRWEARRQARIYIREYSLPEWHAVLRTFFATGEVELRGEA